MRPEWDEYWMLEAYLAAQMCTCARGRKQGAVFVRDNRSLTKGFNGVPAGSPHPKVCLRTQQNIGTGCSLDLCGCKHAEVNGIANAAREGIRLRKSILYCTTFPCVNCMGELANVGIKKIVYHNEYPSEQGLAIASNAGIKLLQFGQSDQLDAMVKVFPPARYGPSQQFLGFRDESN
jgi:dCMP deaminase